MGGKIKLMAVMLVASLCVTACGRDKKQSQQTTPAETTKGRTMQGPPPPAEAIPVTGKVLEIIDTGSFVYVSLDWNGKQVWATVPGVDLKVGEVISLDNAAMLENGFRSNALNRNFDKMIMASGVTGKPPRGRATTRGANPKDPRNRRSGQLMGVLQPAPPQPTKKVAGKAGQ